MMDLVVGKMSDRNQSLGMLASIMKTLLLGLVIIQLSGDLIARLKDSNDELSDNFNLLQGVAALDAPQSINNSTIKPHWHRLGCYQVGHTRTISIPGCVKFNLSTNACRGFCMSFSIPAAEDIGPSPEDELDGLVEASDLMLSGNNVNSDFAISDRMAKRDRLQPKRRSDSLMDLLEADSNRATNQPTASSRQRFGQFLHLSGETRSPLSGALGSIGEKRDVISVGQCCNMMETEDVTVNLRCGYNETRRLVFKSAKTCECFFCKHV